MKRIDTTTRSLNKFGAGKDGFTNGNVVGGIPATDLTDTWFDNVQEELANVVEAAGIVLNGSDLTQVMRAIKLLTPGRLLRISYYKLIAGVLNVSVNGGAFTPFAGVHASLAATTLVRVRAQGGGSSGGGAAATGSGQYAAGLGGMGGSYGEGIYTSGFASLVITVGSGGAAPAAGNTAGIAGGATSVGALLTAPGGVAPPAAGPANSLGNGSVVDNSPNALPSGANLIARTGAGGGFRFYLSTGQFIGSRGGAAGDGGAGPGMQNNGSGAPATNPGAGGSAGTIGPNLAAVPGGAGGDGYAIIEEFA